MLRLILFLLLLAPPALAELTVDRQARHGDWTALRARNSDGVPLCSAETRGRGVTFRVNYYNPANSFAELFPMPHGAPGPGSLVFDSDDLDMRVDAQRYEDAWIVELTDPRMTGALILVLSEARALTITDGQTDVAVPTSGSRAALEAFVACTRRLHLPG